MGGTAATTLHQWDGQNIVVDEDVGGGVRAKYLRGIGPLAQDRSGTREYYLHNAHGDVVQRVGVSGVSKTYTYDAFGNESGKTAGDANPFRYCGEYLDLSSGEYYLRNRMYNPVTGRFTSEDPARSGLNWYTYCGNNPVIYADPFGLDAIYITQSDAVGIFGHSGSVVQDKAGDWFFFYWGNEVLVHRIEDASVMESSSSFNKYLDGLVVYQN